MAKCVCLCNLFGVLGPALPEGGATELTHRTVPPSFPPHSQLPSNDNGSALFLMEDLIKNGWEQGDEGRSNSLLIRDKMVCRYLLTVTAGDTSKRLLT